MVEDFNINLYYQSNQKGYCRKSGNATYPYPNSLNQETVKGKE